jgi:PPK2 family polyphosphate:nucleotide phosphotransferase
MNYKFQSLSTRAPKDFEKEHIKDKTAHLLQELKELQKVLYAQSGYSVLIILQGLDASGKDGVVNKVFSGLNPLGVNVAAFKVPTAEELSHDFLWRIHKQVPAKGQITIFNRSHYEDVLVPVVEKQVGNKTIESRYDHINNFEKLLIESNTLVLKFYLHISREEQLQRLTERKTNPEKFWKHSDGDWITSQKWDKYMKAYQDIFKKCNTPHWTIVPSDQNWYKEYIIAASLVDKLKKLDLKYPKLEEGK